MNFVSHPFRSSVSIISFLRGQNISTFPLSFPSLSDFHPFPNSPIPLSISSIPFFHASLGTIKLVIQTFLLIHRLLNITYCRSLTKLDCKDVFEGWVLLNQKIQSFSWVSWKRRKCTNFKDLSKNFLLYRNGICNSPWIGLRSILLDLCTARFPYFCSPCCSSLIFKTCFTIFSYEF